MKLKNIFKPGIYEKFGLFVLLLGILFVGSFNVKSIEVAGTSSYDWGSDVAVDSNDNILLTGSTSYTGKEYDLWTIKYDSNGSMLWNKTAGGISDDWGLGVAVDKNDNVIVTGRTKSFGSGDYDFWTIKYDSNGNMLWNRTAGGSGQDEALGVAVDENNNIIVTGREKSFGEGGYGIWTIKYDSNGNMLWNKTIRGGLWDVSYGVAVDKNNNIVIAGDTASFSNKGINVWIAKYDPNGNIIWNRTTMGSSGGIGWDVTIDSNDDIILTGSTGSYSMEYNIWTIKYDSDGNIIWNKTAGGISNDWGFGVASDKDNNIIVIGITNSFGTGDYDFWTIKYDTNGNMIWSKTAGGRFDDAGMGVAVDAVDKNSNIIVSGRTGSFSPGGYDFWAIKYDPYGNVIWSKTPKGAFELEKKESHWKTYLIIGMIIFGLILLFLLFRRWKKSIM